jgi:pimeloyl-ACP methyl ester carboxylesterase
VLSSLADGGHDIVIILHSYGGIPGTQAVAGLSKASRLAEGKKGGVIALVYLCAFLLQKGESLVSFEGGLNPSYTVIDDHVLPPPLEFCYSNLPAEEAAAWYAMLKPMSLKAWQSELSYEAYRDVRSTYLICEADEAIPVKQQERMIRAVGEADGEDVVWVERCGSGHSPMLKCPVRVVEVIRRAAGEIG